MEENAQMSEITPFALLFAEEQREIEEVIGAIMMSAQTPIGLTDQKWWDWGHDD